MRTYRVTDPTLWELVGWACLTVGWAGVLLLAGWALCFVAAAL